MRHCNAGLTPDGDSALYEGRFFARVGGPRTLPNGDFAWDVQPCPDEAAHYVCTELGVTGGSEDGSVRITGTDYEALCDRHNEEAKRRPGWAWSRPLGLGGDSA